MVNSLHVNPDVLRMALRQRAYSAAKPHPLNSELVLIENGDRRYIYTPEGFAERVRR